MRSPDKETWQQVKHEVTTTLKATGIIILLLIPVVLLLAMASG